MRSCYVFIYLGFTVGKNEPSLRQDNNTETLQGQTKPSPGSDNNSEVDC